MPRTTRGGNLIWALEEDPGNLAPLGGVPTAHHWGKELVYDSLLEWNQDLHVCPALATSYEMRDERTYVFRLRKNVKFHNGDRLSADDVKYSLDAQQNPPPPGRRVTVGDHPEIGQVDALDRYTVRVEMNVSDPSLPGWLAWGRYSSIIPADAYARYDLAKEGVGTGPFQLVEYEPGEKLIYTRFAEFWKPDRPLLEGVELRIISDEDERIEKVIRGEIDGGTVPRSAVGRATEAGLQVLRGPTAAHRELQFTVKDGIARPWHDKRVRQAFNLLIDRDEIIDVVYGGDGEYTGFVPPGFGPWVVDECDLRRSYQRHDPGAAQDLLTAAGFGDGFTLEFLVLGEPADAPECAALVAEQLASGGIEARMQTLPSVQFFERRDSGHFEMALTVRGIRGDVSGFFNEFAPGAPSYSERFDGWRPPTALTELVLAGRSTVDHDERIRTYRAAQEILFDECIHIPLIQAYKYQVAAPRVHDMHVAYSDFNPGLRDVWIDDDGSAL